jgi:TRAP-type C4-dicarboxylate transport system permease small subunit
MSWLDRLLTVVGSVVPAALLGIVVVVVTANVVARTVLGVPFHTAHDLALVSFAGVVWFGVIGATINGQMFGVNFFVERLPGRLSLFARLLARIIVVLIAVAVIHASWAQIETARFTKFLALGWPKWIVSAGLLVSMLLMIVVQVREAASLMTESGSRKGPS